MVVIWIPSLMRELTDGIDKIELQAITIRDAINQINQMYPRFKDRVLEDDSLKEELSVVVDGVVSDDKLRHDIETAKEVHILPFISGG